MVRRRTILWTAGAAGAVLHVLATTVAILLIDFNGYFECGELSCWVLVLMDFPVSLLFATSSAAVTWGSLLLGSLWWGTLFVLIAAICTRVLRSSSPN